MNKIIVISPYADESALVEKLTEALGASVQVSHVDSIQEAQAVNGVAIIKHFAKGVKTLNDILDIDAEVIVATHGRTAINEQINKLLTDEEQDGTDKVSNFSTGAWQIFSLSQRFNSQPATSVGESNVSFITQGFDSIFGYLENAQVTEKWREEWRDNHSHSTHPRDPQPSVIDEAVPEQVPAPEPLLEPEEEPAISAEEQPNVANEELQTAPEVQPATEVHSDPEPEPTPEVEWEQTQTKTSEPTPEVKVETKGMDDFDPFNITTAFQDSIAEGKDAETAEAEKTEESSEKPKAKKKRHGIDVTRPETEHTVEIQTNPLKDPGEDFNHARGFEDWGGGPKTHSKIIDSAARKIEQAQRSGQTPRLSMLEGIAIDTQQDAVGAELMHEFQYVAGANWSQGIKTKTVTMPLIVPIKNPTYGDKKYVGSDAVALLKNRMKIGSTLGVFLPHTGIYFIIVSPTDGELLDTLSVINTQRIETLRASSGILMGNSNYYIHRQVLNLFMNSITNCSFRSWNREQLFDLIDERDINIIATALMASVYTDGYEYTQTCGLELEVDETLSEEERNAQKGEVCSHRSEFLADLIRTIFVDNSRLNEFQRTIAVSAIHPRTYEEIMDYQQQHYIGYKKPYEIDEGIQFVYRAQSVKTSMEAGEKWIGEISAIVDSIITFRNDDEERNAMIDHRINLARIREFSHWVDEIIIDGQPLTDREKINALLNSLSRNEKVMLKVSQTLGEFQRLSMIAITAIPRVTCPSCKKTDTRDLDISKHLIPQDAVSRLFTLVRQRV